MFVAGPSPKSDRVSKQMREQRTRDTDPEVRLRRELHSRGLRYQLQRRVPERPRQRIDICFPTERVAVFVDGCFWHGCPQHYVASKTNPDYWAPKIAANAERDVRSTALLVDAGWTVLRFWTHTPAAEIAAAVVEAVRATGPAAGEPGP